jgi:hypothetical protein
MLLNRTLISVCAVLCFFAGNVYAHSEGGIVVKDAWVREAPPNAKVVAAYMTIENHTGEEKVLISVTSSAFGKIEIHKTVNKDGMASMEQQKELSIAAEGNVKLEPGGLHLMLFNPGAAVKAGDTITLSLKFANGSTSMASAIVKKAAGGSEHHHDSAHEEHKTHAQPEKEHTHDESHQHSH